MTEHRPVDHAASEHEVSVQLDDASVKAAEAFLGELSSALFPAGEVGIDLLTWADSFAGVQDLQSAGSIEERLKSAEARFVTLVEQIPAVTFMAVLGEGANEIYVSPHIERMLGYSQAEWLSDPFLWYTRLHVDDRVIWNEEFTRGCYKGGPFRAECRFLARDGHVVWVHGEARLVKDARGRPQFLQGVAFDITESKRAQQALLDNAVQRAKVEEELAIARRVQTSILPRNPALDGLDIATVMLPADDVGGDYYDFRPMDDGGWIAIGDVSGHGLDAGLIMLLVQSAISAIATSRTDATPSELLNLLNQVMFDAVAKRLARSDYVTLSVLRYRRDGQVVFAGAHQEILIHRAATQTVERVSTPGPWVGILNHIHGSTVNTAFTLHDGDVMVLYTDGILEAMDERGEQYDIDRLCTALTQSYTKSPAAIRDHIIAQVRAWMHQQQDDMTLLVARYSASSST